MNLEKKLKPRKSILVFGGYGYGNVGDEAQLSSDLKDLQFHFPEHIIKILSPNPSYTSVEHPGFVSIDAPRTAFYDQGESRLYNIRLLNKSSAFHYIGNEIYKFLFLMKSNWILFNGILTKYGLPTFFLKAKRSQLIYEVSRCDFVFFEGGGYMTGSTLSRLWDGLAFILLARLFRKKVFMSGQTIGNWNSSFNKLYAKVSLKYVNTITVRDPRDSYQDLVKVGFPENRIKIICDDALFCEKKQSVGNVLEYSYITYQFHYWGCVNQREKSEVLRFNRELISDLLEKYDYHVELLSMTPSDEEAISDLMAELHHERLHFKRHTYDFREIRTLISESQLCITMKHHPIIFSLGETVPVISISNNEYYHHKNNGALMLFGLERYNLDLSSSQTAEKVEDLIEELLSNAVEFKRKVSMELVNKKEKRDSFFELIAKTV